MQMRLEAVETLFKALADAGRLQMKTGCCLPAPVRFARPCCAAEVRS